MPKAATKKAQVVLTEEQYQLLDSYAQEQGKTVSSLLRESLEQTLIASLERRRRQSALRRLTGQQLPTADWEEIERELQERSMVSADRHFDQISEIRRLDPSALV